MHSQFVRDTGDYDRTRRFDVDRVIQFVLRLGLILMATGLLVTATLWVQKEAYQSVKTGLIRIHPINKALVDRRK